MKVLLINKYLYPKGGDAVVALDTTRLLTSKGHEVGLWGMEDLANPVYPYAKYFVSNVDYDIQMGLHAKIRASSNILYSFEARRKLEKLLDEFKPDIVHLHNFAHQISPSILHTLKKRGIPSVMTLHDYKLVCASYSMIARGRVCEACKGGRYYHCFLKACVKDSHVKSLVNMLEMYLHHDIMHIYKYIDTFISPSRFLMDKVVEMGFKGNIVHLPNFLRSDNYTTSFGYRSKEIVYFGRLSEEKGLFTLLDAVKKINGIGLRIIGDGPLMSILQKKAKDENMTGVRFFGRRGGDELKKLISEAMFSVLSSEWYENNPRSIMEAFAMGKPVVGSKIGGIPELIKDGQTGLTFKAGDSEDLRHKIDHLCSDPDSVHAMGTNARNFVEQELNEERHYRSLIEIYKRVIDNRISGSTAGQC